MKPGIAGSDHEAVLAAEIAKRLTQFWPAHLAGRADGFRVIIHVSPGQGQAKIEWPAPLPDEIKVTK